MKLKILLLILIVHDTFMGYDSYQMDDYFMSILSFIFVAIYGTLIVIKDETKTTTTTIVLKDGKSNRPHETDSACDRQEQVR